MHKKDVFSYEIKKDQKVFIYWHEKKIKILSGENGKRFLTRVDGADDDEAQRIMAQATGNIKRKRDGDTETIVIRGAHYTRGGVL